MKNIDKLVKFFDTILETTKKSPVEVGQKIAVLEAVKAHLVRDVLRALDE